MAASITGVNGLIKWSYYIAAQLEGYAVYRDQENHWTMTATIVLSDPFKLRQRPLMFVAPYVKEWCALCGKVLQVCLCREPQPMQKPGEWRWPITSIQMGTMTGQTKIEAVLGPPID